MAKKRPSKKVRKSRAEKFQEALIDAVGPDGVVRALHAIAASETNPAPGETKPPDGETISPTAEQIRRDILVGDGTSPVTPASENVETPGERLAREAVEAATAAVSKTKRDIMRTFKDTLPVRLTEHELAAAATRASITWDDVVAKRQTLKDESALLRGAVKEAEVEHAKVMQAISTGTAQMEVVCVDILDWENKVVITERTDIAEGQDGRVVAKRNMTEAETQYPLKLEGGTAGAEPDKLDAAIIVAAITNEVEGAKKLRWHARDGKLCDKVGCKARHTDNADMLRRAGREVEMPAGATAEPDEAEREQLGDALAAPETPESVESELNGGVLRPKDGRWNDSPSALYRGQHDDDVRCFNTACEKEHFNAKALAAPASPVFAKDAIEQAMAPLEPAEPGDTYGGDDPGIVDGITEDYNDVENDIDAPDSIRNVEEIDDRDERAGEDR